MGLLIYLGDILQNVVLYSSYGCLCFKTEGLCTIIRLRELSAPAKKLMDYTEHCASLSPVLSRLVLGSVALAIQTATFWPGSLGAKLTSVAIPRLTLPQNIGVVDQDF